MRFHRRDPGPGRGDPSGRVTAPGNILIIRPSALGDVCRTVPVLASLRRAFPAARIDWLVQDTFVDAIWHHPALTQAIPFPRKQLGRDLRGGRWWRVLAWLQRLRSGAAGRYDVVLDCQGLARSGLLTRFTGARQRAGYSDARELGWLGLNQRILAPATLHTVDRMLALVNGIGVEPVTDMRLYTGPQERAWAERQARLWEGPRSGYVVIAPTSRWPGKRWPQERLVGVAKGVLEGGIGSVAVVGAETERDQCAGLLQLAGRDPRIADLVGKTTVGQLMAMVQGAALVVANDSAALHMAVGFDRPSIGLFGPTRTELVGPYQKHSPRSAAVALQHIADGDWLDHKDEASGRALMERIQVAEVLDAAWPMLGSMGAPSGIEVTISDRPLGAGIKPETP